jgi:hypothetical protein
MGHSRCDEKGEQKGKQKEKEVKPLKVCSMTFRVKAIVE